MNALADGAFLLEQPGLSISANGSPVVHKSTSTARSAGI